MKKKKPPTGYTRAWENNNNMRLARPEQNCQRLRRCASKKCPLAWNRFDGTIGRPARGQWAITSRLAPYRRNRARRLLLFIYYCLFLERISSCTRLHGTIVFIVFYDRLTTYYCVVRPFFFFVPVSVTSALYHPSSRILIFFPCNLSGFYPVYGYYVIFLYENNSLKS